MSSTFIFFADNFPYFSIQYFSTRITASCKYKVAIIIYPNNVTPRGENYGRKVATQWLCVCL